MQSAVLTCETCGGALRYSADGLSAVCPYCGNTYNFSSSKTEALILALNRANAMRLACDFDDAIREYTLITQRNPEDAEAHWGLALSRYGIEYVRDSRTGLLVPTCRRTVEKEFTLDEDFIAAEKYAGEAQAEAYRARAAVISRLQRDIKRRLADEEDFDVFICYRSADQNGAPTEERTAARRIYDELARRNIKTFFSEITLKSRLGEDFEPIIYKALYSCKFFILVAFSEENINAPWVKNEWSRFRDREQEEHLNGACCAVFKNISASQLPPFLRSQQGINLAKYPLGGYETELADALEAKFSRKDADTVSRRPQASAALLSRAWRDLSDEMYESANTKFLQVLDTDDCCGEAWWGCFLAERNAYSAGLAAQNVTYQDALTLKTDRNLKNAERYGDGEVLAKVASYRKMCAFRCGELAAESKKAESDARGRLAALAAERKRAAADREKTFKKLERARKTAASDPKLILKLMGAMVVFVALFFGLIGLLTKVLIILYVGLGMAAMCLLAAVLSYAGMKSNVRTASQDILRLEQDIARIDGEMERMSDEREKLEKTAEEQSRRAAAFANVFKN